MKFVPSYESGRWLVPLFLLIGVLAPTVCVLWFLNEAVNNQRAASARKLSEAYREQLRLLRERADVFWDKRAVELEAVANGRTPAEAFAEIAKRGLADSAIGPGYPSAAVAMQPDPAYNRPEWMSARALEGWHDLRGAAEAYARIAAAEHDPSIAARAQQSRIRCLARAGDRAAAIQAIEHSFTSGPLAGGRDLAGRLIAADEWLLAVQLGAKAAAERAGKLAADYSVPMPSQQRLFLMEELRMPSRFPTLEAERLAARFIESGRTTQTADGALAAAGIPDVWKFAAEGSKVTALYRTATIAAAVPGLKPPGAPTASGEESIAAGVRLPGWQIAIAPPAGESADAMARRQTLSYVWVGGLAIAVVAIAGIFAGQAVQRQWRMARLKTDLVAAVSHELKTPLSSMRVLVDVLLEEERPDAARTREYLEMIARENTRLSRLIENFLTFSRLERNRQRFEFTNARPARVVQLAVEAGQGRYPALDVSVAPELPMIRADEDAMVTVLLNLLDNAYKYTPGEKRIALRVFGENGRVVFAVEDNGIGIPPRERKRIFRRFYQVDRRLARDAGGCGLGLSIVDLIVKAHGGRVEVSGSPGQGSTFAVVLS